MSHTKGPWEIGVVYKKNTDNPAFWYVCMGKLGSPNGYQFGTIYSTEQTRDELDKAQRKGEQVWCMKEANARLIAAAPDLLEACQSALQAIKSSGESWTTLHDDLTAAIAKATQ